MDSVSYKLLKGDNAVELPINVTSKDSFYRAAQILETTEFEGDTDLEKSVLNIGKPGYDDGLTIIISDFFTESNWKKMIDFLVYRRREVIMIQVLSPDELYPGFDGRIDMQDSESADRNMKMMVTKKSMQAYQQALDEYENELIDFCASRGVTFFTVSSDEPIERVIFGKGFEAEVIK
jgi:hypothetical protein